MISNTRRLQFLALILFSYTVQPSVAHAQHTYVLGLNNENKNQQLISPILLSSLNTLVPVIGGYFMLANDNDALGVGLMLYGFGVGPGTGFLVTERPQWIYAGLAFRAVGLAMVYGGADAILADSAKLSSGAWVLTIVGTAITAASIYTDFIWVDRLQKDGLIPDSRWPSLGVIPLLGFGRSGSGFLLSVAF